MRRKQSVFIQAYLAGVPTTQNTSLAGAETPRLSAWQRVRYAMVRPDDDASTKEPQEERSLDEVEESIARADDKERAIGLIAGPIAAFLSFLIIGTLIHNDPPLGAKNYVDPSMYHTLQFVLLGLSVAILATALWRKRMFMGISFALYGLAIFNLHYWGFGVPFLLAGAWYLVRGLPAQPGVEATRGNRRAGQKCDPPRHGWPAARRTSGTRRRPDRLGRACCATQLT